MKRAASTLAVVAAVALGAATSAHAQPTTAPWTNAGDIVVSPDGRNVYAAGASLLSYTRDPASGELTQLGETPFDATQIAVSPDGRFVYLAADGVIHVLARDAETGKLLHSHSVTGGVDYGVAFGELPDLAVSADGTKLYVAQSRESALIVLERNPTTGGLAKGQVVFADEEPLGHYPRIAAAADGRDVYLAGGRLTHFHADASGRLERLPTLPEHFDGVAIARDGQTVFASRADGMRRSYRRDLSTGALTKLADYNRPGDTCTGCWRTAPLFPGAGATLFAATGPRGEVQRFSTRDSSAITLEASVGGIENMPFITEASASPDGRSVYVTGSGGLPFPQPTQHRAQGVIAAIDTRGAMTTTQRLVPRIAGGLVARFPGVSIAGGAIWVNSREVKVNVAMPVWRPAAIEISNDGGFAGSRRLAFEPSGEYSWTLPAGSTPERMVKRIWVRFVPNGLPDREFPASSVVMDDVILDTAAPRLTSAKVRGRRLVLRARDNRSGVTKLQVTTNRKKPGAARRFRSRVTAPRGKKPVYVRVIDGAGNNSAWRRAAR